VRLPKKEEERRKDWQTLDKNKAALYLLIGLG
jgi:hypothetical protein